MEGTGVGIFVDHNSSATHKQTKRSKPKLHRHTSLLSRNSYLYLLGNSPHQSPHLTLTSLSTAFSHSHGCTLYSLIVNPAQKYNSDSASPHSSQTRSTTLNLPLFFFTFSCLYFYSKDAANHRLKGVVSEKFHLNSSVLCNVGATVPFHRVSPGKWWISSPDAPLRLHPASVYRTLRRRNP